MTSGASRPGRGTRRSDATPIRPAPQGRIVLSGFLLGCGIAASVIDLFIFHLVLQWHRRDVDRDLELHRPHGRLSPARHARPTPRRRSRAGDAPVTRSAVGPGSCRDQGAAQPRRAGGESPDRCGGPQQRRSVVALCCSRAGMPSAARPSTARADLVDRQVRATHRHHLALHPGTSEAVLQHSDGLTQPRSALCAP